MSTDLAQFEFVPTGHTVRTVMIDGDPWFVAADVCAILGLDRYRDVMSGLDEDEKVRDTVAGTIVDLMSESALYSVILRSRKAEARDFKRWVTREVLPAIRKTGAYGMPAPVTLPSRAELAQMVLDAERELAIAAPKAAFVDAYISPTDDAILVGTAAKMLGFKDREFRTWLTANKLIFRKSQPWGYEYLPYAGPRAAWFEVRVHENVTRGTNGQLATTLYILPPGMAGIKLMLDRTAETRQLSIFDH